MPVNVNDRDPSAVLFICKSKIHLNYLPTFSSKKAARMEQPGYTHSFTFLPSAYGKSCEIQVSANGLSMSVSGLSGINF